MAHFDPIEEYKDHGREGARLSRPLLIDLGYPGAQVEAICYAIAVHVDGKADFDHEHTLEADIVSDADNIDRFGGFRILHWCAPLMDDHRALVENLIQCVDNLQGYIEDDPLEAPTGQQLLAGLSASFAFVPGRRSGNCASSAQDAR